MSTIIFDPDTLDDVFANVGESLYTDQVAACSYGDESSGLVYTIGQTCHGTLYGLEENGYGQHVAYRFITEAEQREWFDDVFANVFTA